MHDHTEIEKRILEQTLTLEEIAEEQQVSVKTVQRVRQNLSPFYSTTFDRTLTYLQKQCVKMVALWGRFLPKAPVGATPVGGKGEVSDELTDSQVKAGALSLRSLSELRRVLTLVLTVLDKVSNMQRTKEFQDTVITEIARESPECARRIMLRLKAVRQIERTVK
jgi:hypothetical protein